MGRVMCSIIADSCGWHDTIGGLSNAAIVHKKYGDKPYQEAHNSYFKNGYDSLINELGAPVEPVTKASPFVICTPSNLPAAYASIEAT